MEPMILSNEYSEDMPLTAEEAALGQEEFDRLYFEVAGRFDTDERRRLRGKLTRNKKLLIVVLGIGLGIAALMAATIIPWALALPDMDIVLVGLGSHRHWLFHSAFFPLTAALLRKLVVAVTERIFEAGHWAVTAVKVLTGAAVVFLSIGVGLHLLLDTIRDTGGTIRFPFIGSMIDGTFIDDWLWTGIHTAICTVIGWVTAIPRAIWNWLCDLFR